MAYTAEARERNRQNQFNQNQTNMSKPQAGAETKQHLNEGLGLEQFDYSDGLRDEAYNAYLDIVEGKKINPKDFRSKRSGGLNGQKKYVFEEYNVRPIFEEVYPGMKDTPKVCVGFKMVTTKPLKTTTTFLKDAILLNRALDAMIGGANNNPIFYYLLQIPKN